ncbi:hypothetical protein DQ04_04451060 [Trypanosoma grayi]|uniref:hypothetical protein n=1 Tax=Trypanosoma grayi TaxID=71804 RepID=UPI0004F3FEE7|nr:hypothetical protein DQ04_04451060 [Trypanosoma grayi]KEG09915.1 hypothetical protein DQ04_04451060 [Trypanosoma grayi]
MRGVHPAIAELKRRNRAAGRRLSPLDRKPSNTIPSSSPTRQYGRTSSATASHASTVRQPARNGSDRSGMESRFMSTAPVETNDGRQTDRNRNCTSNNNNNNNGNWNCARNAPRPPPKRVPTKPRPTIEARTSIVTPQCEGEAPVGNATAVRERGMSPSATPSKMRDVSRPSSTPTPLVPTAEASVLHGSGQQRHQKQGLFSRKDDSTFSGWDFKHHASNEEDEVQSIDGYTNRAHWDEQLPGRVRAVLDGNQLEDPFATDLWTKTQGGETRQVNCYYACIRCGVPVVSPKYQVKYAVRGIAAFSRLNKRAVEVRIGCLATATNATAAGSAALMKRPSLQLQARCRCCDGLLGLIVPTADTESATAPWNVLAINSCCLKLVKGKRTRCRLDGVCDGEDNDKCGNGALSPRSRGSVDYDFDDPDIFEVHNSE